MPIGKKNSVKRKVILFLAIILLIEIFPYTAFSNYQNPVTDLSVTDYSDRNANNYTVNLRWSRPVASRRVENNPSIINPPFDAQDNGAQAAGYDVFHRNASKSQNFNTPITDELLKMNTSDVINVRYVMNLDSGSLYEFKVTPYHMHTYLLQDGSQINKPAPLDISINESLALYLTDLEVSAVGSGKNLTVTWDNPTMDGKEIFTGYRIYYAAGGSQVVEIPNTPFIEVSSSAPDLIRTREGKLQYTFEDAALKIGKLYAVKVEPVFNNAEVRRLQTININNKEYSISYRNRIDHEYRTNDAYISPSLSTRPEGQDYIRIFWDSLKGSINNIQRLEIYSSPYADMKNSQRIGELFNDSARDISYWLTKRPEAVNYYQIFVYYKEADEIVIMKSEIAWFDPAYNDFLPYKPTVLNITDSAQKPYKLSITWQAFARQAYNANEMTYLDPEYDNLYIDRNVLYDIYITDEVRNFDNPQFNDKIIATYFGQELTIAPLKIDSVTLPTFTADAQEYITRDETGVFIKRPLEENKVYYVRIIAIRDPGLQTSKPALSAHFIVSSADLETNPLMLTSPPLRIKRDNLGIEMISSDSITIQWDLIYYEAYQDLDRNWYAKIGVDENGELLYGDKADNLPPEKIIFLNHPKYLLAASTPGSDVSGTSLIKKDLKDMGASENKADALAIRLSDISSSEFEIHTVTYDAMRDFGGYEKYLQQLLTEENDSLWRKISQTGDPLHPDYTITDQEAPKKSELKPNTAYVIFFRPFVMRQQKKAAYFPSHLLITTITERESLDIIPVVPILEPVSETDLTLTVRWNYSADLQYELQFSSQQQNYPDKGILISWETISTGALIKSDDKNNYAQFTIEELFPNTSYTIWIRASAGNLISAWSNPIQMNTKDIESPNPPDGLGLAAKSHVNIYNENNNTSFSVVDDNSMVVEWLRDSADKTENITTQENPNAIFLPAADIVGMYMVKLQNLLGNKGYYLRAKTILTVLSGQDSSIKKEYNYTLQVSLSPDFSNPIEITVPVLTDLTQTKQSIRKESEWTEYIVLFTSRTSGEYNGNVNPSLFPLPDKDYEIIFDSSTNTLTYRFRTNKKDQRGNHDNYVDQRLISRLVQEKKYVYLIDLASYDNKVVYNRVVDIPFSVLQAFDERKINLKINAGDTELTFYPEFTQTAETKNLHDFGADARVQIIIEEISESKPINNYTEQYISEYQKLSIKINTPSKTIFVNQPTRYASIIILTP